MRKVTKPCRILSTGLHVPNPVDSHEIEREFGLPLGWSEKHSGVVVRHKVKGENVADLGAKAAQNALDAASLKLSDMDAFITAGASTDQIIPSQAALTLSKMNAGDDVRCETFHVNTTCLSFMTAFGIAADMLRSPDTNRILIVASEVSSVGIGPENWETLTLFGDGAAAVVLEKAPDDTTGIIWHQQQTFTEGIHSAEIPGGGITKWIEDFPFDPAIHHFQMDGRELLRLTLRFLPGFMDDFFESAGTAWPEVSWTVPHQASKAGLGMIPKLADVDPNRVVNILERTGNCIAASIPMALHHLFSQGNLKSGETALMVGTSAGYSIGALLYQHG